jgi:hypothetical protein
VEGAGVILTIGDRKTNAELMRDCALLGYLDGTVLDATHEWGRFWKLCRPAVLVTNDINPECDTHFHCDFRDLPFTDQYFDTVVFDPPYKLNGKSTGKGPSAADARYGVGGEYKTVAEKHMLIKDGIAECARVAKRYLLIKCMDQVVSNKKHWQTDIFTRTAERHGFFKIDQLHVSGYRKQPLDTQNHAHGDYSTLLICERQK